MSQLHGTEGADCWDDPAKLPGHPREIADGPRVLTVNGGSSSIKFALFEIGSAPRRILEGSIEQIGLPEAALRVKGDRESDNFVRKITAPDHTAAVEVLMDWISGRIAAGELAAVGHRVVHGGPKYWEPQRITPEMVEALP